MRLNFLLFQDTYTLDDVSIHRSYSKLQDSWKNDITLLKLSRHADGGIRIAQICIGRDMNGKLDFEKFSDKRFLAKFNKGMGVRRNFS